MNDIKIPVIRGGLPASKVMSMDMYLDFVRFNLKNTVDAKARRGEKRRIAVDVSFKA